MKNFIRNFSQFQRVNEQYEENDFQEGGSVEEIMGQLKRIAKGCGADIFKPSDEAAMLYVPQPTRNDEYANRWVLQVYTLPGEDGFFVTTEHSDNGEMGVRGSENYLVQGASAKEALAAISDWCSNA